MTELIKGDIKEIGNETFLTAEKVTIVNIQFAFIFGTYTSVTQYTPEYEKRCDIAIDHSTVKACVDLPGLVKAYVDVMLAGMYASFPDEFPENKIQFVEIDQYGEPGKPIFASQLYHFLKKIKEGEDADTLESERY